MSIDFLQRRFWYTRETLLGVTVLPAELRYTSALDSWYRFRHQAAARAVSRSKKISGWLVGVLLIVGGGLSVLFTAPDLYYRLNPAGAVAVPAQTASSPLGGDFAAGIKAEPAIQYEPPQDETLPEGDWLIISRIGVRSQLLASHDPAEALETGMWLVPEFGRAGDTAVPMVVAAHRYGWQWWWKTDYWKYNSFYHLPETEPGDIVEVISDQRKWQYEIYAGEENDEITDYDANLILYTCKFLNSPARHVRYARLLDPTKDTQNQS